MLSRSRTRVVALLATVASIGSGVVAFTPAPAQALTLTRTQTAWSNVNGVNKCDYTALRPSKGGNRAVNSEGKLKATFTGGPFVNDQVHLRLFVHTWFDLGAAEASEVWRELAGSAPACGDLRPYVGKKPSDIFRNVACTSPRPPAEFCRTPASWQSFVTSAPGLTGRNCDANDVNPPETYEWGPGLGVWVGVNQGYGTWFDRLGIYVGEGQQRIATALGTEAWTRWWEAEAWKMVATMHAPVQTVTANDGRPMFNLPYYQGIASRYGLAGEIGNEWYSICKVSPWSRNALDPTGQLAKDGIDGAFRNLIDSLAKVPQGTNVLCTQKNICGNILDIARTVWGLNGHGVDFLKAFIGQLLS